MAAVLSCLSFLPALSGLLPSAKILAIQHLGCGELAGGGEALILTPQLWVADNKGVSPKGLGPLSQVPNHRTAAPE